MPPNENPLTDRNIIKESVRVGDRLQWRDEVMKVTWIVSILNFSVVDGEVKQIRVAGRTVPGLVLLEIYTRL